MCTLFSLPDPESGDSCVKIFRLAKAFVTSECPVYSLIPRVPCLRLSTQIENIVHWTVKPGIFILVILSFLNYTRLIMI